MTDKQREERNKELCWEVMDWHDSDAPRKEEVSVFFLRLTAKYNLAERTIYQILEDNASAILAKRDEQRLRRILRLKREIALKDRSSKDVADLIEQERKEYEGDKPIIDQSKHTHLSLTWKVEDGNGRPRNTDCRLIPAQKSE